MYLLCNQEQIARVFIGLREVYKFYWIPQPSTKSRHSLEGGNPEGIEKIRALDFRLRGNDGYLALKHVLNQEN